MGFRSRVLVEVLWVLMSCIGVYNVQRTGKSREVKINVYICEVYFFLVYKCCNKDLSWHKNMLILFFLFQDICKLYYSLLLDITFFLLLTLYFYLFFFYF